MQQPNPLRGVFRTSPQSRNQGAPSQRQEAPPVPRAPVTRYGPEVAEPQKTIEIRNPRGGTVDTSHPFKMRVTDNDLTVDFGQISIMRVALDTDSKPYPGMENASVAIGANSLRGHPDGGTAGVLTLADDGTYGVWLEFLWSSLTGFDKTAGIVGEFRDWDLYSFSLGVNVITSTAHTTGVTASIMADGATSSYIFIGRVVMTAGVATIFQYLRSDLIVPGMGLPNRILSGDPDQSLGLGGDGGIYYDAP